MTKAERNFRFEAARTYGAGNFVLVNGTEVVSLSERLMEDARNNMGSDIVDPTATALKPNTP